MRQTCWAVRCWLPFSVLTSMLYKVVSSFFGQDVALYRSSDVVRIDIFDMISCWKQSRLPTSHQQLQQVHGTSIKGISCRESKWPIMRCMNPETTVLSLNRRVLAVPDPRSLLTRRRKRRTTSSALQEVQHEKQGQRSQIVCIAAVHQ